MREIVGIAAVALSLVAGATETMRLSGTVEAFPAADAVTLPADKKGVTRFALGIEEMNVRQLPATNVWQRFVFDMPETWLGDRIFLRFETLETDVIVFVNGTRVGEINGDSGEVEVGGVAKAGANTACVYASKDYTGMGRTAADDILRREAYGLKPDYSRRRVGIGKGRVELERCPKVGAVREAWAETSVRRHAIAIRLGTLSARAVDATLVFTAALRGRHDTFCFTREVRLPAGAAELTAEAPWADPVLWDLYRPNVYAATVTLLEGGRVLDARTFTFGFREVWTEGREVLLNGHPAHFHVEMSWFDLNATSLGFFRRLGLNTYYIQPHPNMFWGQWAEHPSYDETVMDLCDDEGIALFVPTISGGRFPLVYNDRAFQERFRAATRNHMRRYRHHPSILGWTFSMNNFNPKDAIHPDTLGRRSHYTLGQGRALEKIAELVKSVDPTRLSCPHADGNLGDVAGGNTYPNWTPVQEIRDYPETWVKKGDMPYFASEYDAIYSGSFQKGVHETLYTEYGAIYFGEDAYARENPTNLAKTVEYGVKSTNHNAARAEYEADGGQMSYDLRNLYVEATDKYWRSAGIQMWQYFHGARYGKPKGKEGRKFSYGSLTAEDFANWQTWTNRNFAIHSRWRQPLLVYLAGAPELADQTHAYAPGEPVVKQVASVWDGAGTNEVSAVWTLLDGARRLAGGKIGFSLGPGAATNVAFRFTAPRVTDRRDFRLVLKGTDMHGTSFEDAFAFSVLPKPAAVTTARRIVLLDRTGRSAWVKDLVPGAVPFESAEKLDPKRDVLVVGRESLELNGTMPWRVSQVAAGLRVVVLEQQPQVFETFGFRLEEVATRQAYPTVDSGVLMQGLVPDDLREWRGRTDLLPEYARSRAPSYTPSPKGSNRHVVSSFVLEIPEVVGFTPLLQAEFDLAYAPILKWAWGEGMIVFSTMDFSGRVGVDPSATQLAANVLRYADTAANPVLGATRLHFGCGVDVLGRAGIAAETGSLRRVTWTGELATRLTRNLGRWRDVIRPAVIREPGAESEGLFFRRGDDVYVQLSDDLLKDRYLGKGDKDDFKRRIAMERSVVRLRQLVSRVKTAYGVPSPDFVARGFDSLARKPGFVDLRGWYVFGPFYQTEVGDLDKTFPGEKEAVAGDLNPNYLFDGKDFRKQVSAGVDGYVDLNAAFVKTDPRTLGYAICEVESPEERDAVLRLGFDWFLKLFVNGEWVPCGLRGEKSVYPEDYRFGCPATPNRRLARIHLKKGTNVICLKMRSGHAGFGFWANLSEPGAETDAGETSNSRARTLYDPELTLNQPYVYSYW